MIALNKSSIRSICRQPRIRPSTLAPPHSASSRLALPFRPNFPFSFFFFFFSRSTLGTTGENLFSPGAGRFHTHVAPHSYFILALPSSSLGSSTFLFSLSSSSSFPPLFSSSSPPCLYPGFPRLCWILFLPQAHHGVLHQYLSHILDGTSNDLPTIDNRQRKEISVHDGQSTGCCCVTPGGTC